MPKFAHLHVHSHYSLLDGLSKIPDLISYAKEQGFESLALTDHGVMHGIVEFYKEATTQGLKPILGMEAYVAPRALTDKQPRIDDQLSHLVLLARTVEGYKNLLRLSTIAQLQGFYYKPRLDHQTLKQYHAGLVALSGCLKGEIPQALRRGDEAGAKQLANTYSKIFGDNNFYLEIQAHPEMPEQVELNKRLRDFSRLTSLPLIATNDSHYLHSDDQEAQDILVCIQTGKTVDDAERLDMRGLDTSLKSEAVMRQDLPDFIDAIDQAGTLAQELTVELPMGQRFFPAFPTPEGETPEAYLRLMAEQGLARHYPEGVTEEVRQRMEYELGIIMKKGYASYFLVVADFVNWARQQNIIATTRGSAAGSLVSYLIGITNINPLTYGLPFERFLNPERPSPPDIDMDFADNRRDEVIAYVTAKYGVDRVGQIITFGTMAARAAVRDVGRALGYPYGLCDRVAKLIPFGSQGFHMTIERALKKADELKTLNESDPQVARLLTLARKVEGCARHASIHAAGVVIAPTPLIDYTPLQYDVEGKHIISQFDMWSCEDVGLVKMDFLGIRNLSIMGSAIKIIEKTRGLKIDLEKLPLNDGKTFELMAKGETMGMFQLGGSGMTRYLKELEPSSITDIMAMVALFRPGPMNSIPEFIERKHKPKTITYLDPRLKEILRASYGIITYQDDVLLIAIELAGYTWEEADKLRKAMGKKIPKEMARQKEKFISGCVTKGNIKEDKARALWELIEPFAAYGFNKAHAASYGIVAYQTAYLKANFTTEFMAALMTAESGDLVTVAQAVAECQRLGITVLPPDVNESLGTFTVVDERRIRFGLHAIKNLGEQVAESIINERRRGGSFNSLTDFLNRTAGREVNKKSLESLIKCGALDSLHKERRQLIDSLESLLAYAKQAAQSKNSQQSSLFGATSGLSVKSSVKLAEVQPATTQEQLAWERELLGLYVTAHPFADYASSLAGAIVPLKNLSEIAGEPAITVAGLITAIKPITTKKGEAMLFATIEDTETNCELVVFPDTYRSFRALLLPDTILAIKGRLSKRDGERKIIVQSALRLETAATAPNIIKTWGLERSNVFSTPTVSAGTSLELKLPPGADASTVQMIKNVCQRFSGPTSVSFLVPTGGVWKKISTPFRVEASAEFHQAVAEILSKIPA